ncbi:hypothetical protein MRX96_002436 [Rhipicephalus microplus]
MTSAQLQPPVRRQRRVDGSQTVVERAHASKLLHAGAAGANGWHLGARFGRPPHACTSPKVGQAALPRGEINHAANDRGVVIANGPSNACISARLLKKTPWPPGPPPSRANGDGPDAELNMRSSRRLAQRGAEHA